jgi:uncharacterized protein YndB with AHSA1/START domain
MQPNPSKAAPPISTRTDDNPLQSEVYVAAPPETVFPYFTDPTRMIRWMGRSATLDPVEGGIYRVEMGEASAARGSFVAVEPFHRVVFTFGWEGALPSVAPGTSTVEVLLTAEAGGTRVRLLHHGLPPQSRDPHGRGWALYLSRLAACVTGQELGPGPACGGPAP